MKIILLALLAASLLFIHAKAAQAYDPYPYYAAGVPYPPPSYDPYYELHLIHYQLYRNPYYPYPYFASGPTQVFIIGGWQPAAVSPVQPARKR